MTNVGVFEFPEIKLAYVFLFGILGSLTAYLPLWYKSIGIAKEQIGFLTGIGPVIVLVAGPVVPAIGDLTRNKIAVLAVGATCGVAARTIMYFLAREFWIILLLSALFSASMSGLPSLLDSISVERTRGGYGSARLLGSIGFGIAALIAGTLIGDGKFERAFEMNVLYGFCFILVLLKFRDLDAGESDSQRDDAGSVSFVRGLLRSLQRPDACLFLVVTLFSGSFCGVLDSYLFLRLKELGAPGVLMGLARFVNCISEIPFFFYIRPLMERIGIFNLVALAQLGYILRFATYSVVSNPWTILPMEAIHGLTFASFYACGVHFFRAIAPPNGRSTMQVISSLHHGISPAQESFNPRLTEPINYK
ncbi:hypothetical protein NDN08_006997 [Rhodosorus marinus]|uniref:Major facilitator superfamily associated domain-containing protein n=1 Tax=Rhodosorus marinus TaxID=101924 RepID=A0AAV8UME2_9RHOD|nr:hypothetical protein NDN08_006997 [Rhodosorus marinus]